MRLVRFFDWRFLIALTVLVLVGSVCWTTVVQARDAEAKSRRIDVLVAAIKDEQAASARARERLLDGQNDLQRKYDELADVNQQMADLLRARGISVPGSVTRIETTDNDDSDDDGGGVVSERPRTVRPSQSPRPSASPTEEELLPDLGDTVDDLLGSVPIP